MKKLWRLLIIPLTVICFYPSPVTDVLYVIFLVIVIAGVYSIMVYSWWYGRNQSSCEYCRRNHPRAPYCPDLDDQWENQP